MHRKEQMNKHIPVVFDVDVGCADVVGESLGELLLFSSRTKENKKRNIICFQL